MRLFFILSAIFICACAQAQELRDVKPPVNQPFELLRPDAKPLWIIFACAGLTAFIFYIYRRLKNKTSANITSTPARPAWEVANEQLQNLKQENLLAKGLTKEYYTKLSDIVRRYLEARFNLRAPEMTTEEFLCSLKFSVELNAQHKAALENFLSASDLVKFARYSPDLKEAETSFHFAQQLVSTTSTPGVEVV